MANMLTVTASESLPDDLLAHGRYWVTTEELSREDGRSPVLVRQALARQTRRGRLVSPARGFYLVVPPEYRGRGSIPPEWYVDPLMEHLGVRYYVSFLTAAAAHGAAHQGPQAFQVVTDRDVQDRTIGRTRLHFVHSRMSLSVPVMRPTVHTGAYTLATRETTVADCVWRMEESGGINNVATVITEIGDLDMYELARVAPRHSEATLRRLGWLVARFCPDRPTDALASACRPLRDAPLLDPRGPRRGAVDGDWGVRVNVDVEPDV